VIEQRIDVEILVTDFEMHLPTHECEAGSLLEKEALLRLRIRVAGSQTLLRELRELILCSGFCKVREAVPAPRMPDRGVCSLNGIDPHVHARMSQIGQEETDECDLQSRRSPRRRPAPMPYRYTCATLAFGVGFACT